MEKLRFAKNSSNIQFHEKNREIEVCQKNPQIQFHDKNRKIEVCQKNM